MKNLLRSLTAVLILGGGIIASLHAHPTKATSLSQYEATAERMPIPVCPPNDPNACGIDDKE